MDNIFNWNKEVIIQRSPRYCLERDRNTKDIFSSFLCRLNELEECSGILAFRGRDKFYLSNVIQIKNKKAANDKNKWTKI